MKQLSFEEIQIGLCHCGCGQRTQLAPRNRKELGWIKGQPTKYVVGHSKKHRGGPKVPIGKKWCFNCQRVKNVEDFFRHKHAVGGLQGVCKVCSLERRREWNTKNRERVRFHNVKAKLRRKFGLEIDVYESLCKKQNNLCAICERPEESFQNGHVKSLAVDHNHTTGKIRGLLCNNCNRAIGLLGDSIPILEKAISYLKQHDNSTSSTY